MKKEELKIFEEFCNSYAKRFVDCVCSTTEEKWLHTFSRNRWWRCQMELEEKKNIPEDFEIVWEMESRKVIRNSKNEGVKTIEVLMKYKG